MVLGLKVFADAPTAICESLPTSQCLGHLEQRWPVACRKSSNAMQLLSIGFAKTLQNLLLACVGYSCALLLFSRGFLLSRQTVSNVTIDSLATPHLPRFAKAVIIVIDALRYDFVVWQKAPEGIQQSDESFFHNHFGAFAELASHQPSRSVLLKFMADAPTTTLQRLKGLTTGTLPTFIDAGSNFAASAIGEDNVIYQAHRAGMNITFMGDDTWTSLFGDYFAKSFPFPSFDVKDLDTVDNGVLAHLYSELNDANWNVLIAHFLGVDHCGHRYGPRHPEMRRKLNQMSEVVRNVSNVISDDTVLFVMGDHGMTSSGDHGGDSDDELSAALFVYGRGLTTRYFQNNQTISQVDFVPSFSQLLGLPIPFSNIGMSAPHLFSSDLDYLSALFANGIQVWTYLQEYLKFLTDPALAQKLHDLVAQFAEFQSIVASKESLIELDMVAANIKTAENARTLELWLQAVKSTLEQCWAKFDNFKMIFGLLCFVDTLLWSLTSLLGLTSGRFATALRTLTILIQVAVLYWNHDLLLLSGAFFVAISLLIHCLIIARSLRGAVCRTFEFNDFTLFVSVLACCLHFLTSFSNSFVVLELRVLLFLIVTIYCAFSLQAIAAKLDAQSHSKHYQAKQKVSASDIVCLKPLLHIVACLILLRFALNFQRCREEDVFCSPPRLFALPFANLNAGAEHLFRLILILGALLLLNLMPQLFLYRNGSLNDASFFEVILKFGCPYASVCIGAHFVIEFYFPLAQEKLPLLHLGPALAVYGVFLSSMLAYLWHPSCIKTISEPTSLRTAPSSLLASADLSDANKAVPILFNLLKRSVQNTIDERNVAASEQRVFVFGMATAYTGPLVGLVYTTILLLGLLLGERHVMALVLFFAVLVLTLEIHCASIGRDVNGSSGSNGFLSSHLPFCALWALLTNYFFYALGHQPTFPAIPWSAAFIGIPGNFPYQWIQAAPVLMNIFASQLLFALALPLTYFWHAYPSKTGSLSSSSGQNKAKSQTTLVHSSRNSEAYFITQDPDVCANVGRVFHLYLSLLASKVFGTILAAALLRRHLMVWKIFAPKVVFDAVGLLFSSVAILVAFLFVWRLHRHLRGTYSSLLRTMN